MQLSYREQKRGTEHNEEDANACTHQPPQLCLEVNILNCLVIKGTIYGFYLGKQIMSIWLILGVEF